MESTSSKSLKRDYRFTIIILTFFSLSFNMGVLSFSDVKFRSRKVAVTKGYQNHHKRLYQSCLLDSNDNDGCGNVGDECSGTSGAAFVLSGSICGQNREYTLDNLDDNESGNEIKFCGKLLFMATALIPDSL